MLQMVTLMKGTIFRIKRMDMEFKKRLMEVFTKDLGKTMKRKERVLLFILLLVDMKDSLKMIIKMVLALSLGRMEGNMKEIG